MHASFPKTTHKWLFWKLAKLLLPALLNSILCLAIPKLKPLFTPGLNFAGNLSKGKEPWGMGRASHLVHLGAKCEADAVLSRSCYISRQDRPV